MCLGKCRPGLSYMSFCVIKRHRQNRSSRERTQRTQRNRFFFASFAFFRGYLCVRAGEFLDRLVSTVLFLLVVALVAADASAATPKQQSLNEWRNLTSPGTNAPRAFVRGDNIRFYFQV